MGRLKDSHVIKPEIVEKPKLEVIKVETKEEKPQEEIKAKEVGGRRWWLVGVGVIVACFGIGGFALYASTMNTLLGVAGVFAIAGGAGAIWYGMKERESGVMLTLSGEHLNKITDANCLNIYPDRVAFESLPADKIQGRPRKCRNFSNSFFYVNIWDTAWGNKEAEGKLIPFKLPDTQYRDPREFALNLRIPAHRRLAQRKASMIEKISPFVLVVALIIEGIVMIAMQKPGG